MGGHILARTMNGRVDKYLSVQLEDISIGVMDNRSQFFSESVALCKGFSESARVIWNSGTIHISFDLLTQSKSPVAGKCSIRNAKDTTTRTMPSSAREIRSTLRKEKRERKKKAAEETAIEDKEIEMRRDKRPVDTTVSSPTEMTAQAMKDGKRKATDNAIDCSLSATNGGDQAGNKAEPSKKQQKRARKQKREVWRALLLRVAQKISGDDTLLELVKNSYNSEGREKLLNLVIAIDAGVNKDSNLINELTTISDTYNLEPLRAALNYRHEVKVLRDSIAKRENAELLARYEESLTVQEYENRKLELEEQRRGGERKFVQNEAAAGRVVRDPGIDNRTRRERIRLNSRLMAKMKKQQLAEENSAGYMNEIYDIIGGLRFDADGVDKDTVSGTAAALEVVPVDTMSLPDA
ncbi:hypothetical protein DFP73DRAFT_583638 [Morchella snyderi]|nr:hypothetical protein DFP73DRAFT_583638 [Morchella snyderi]